MEAKRIWSTPKAISPFAWFASFKAHPIVWAIGSILTLVGVFSDVGAVVSWIQANAAMIAALPDHTWLRWLFILAGLGLMGWAALRSGRSSSERAAEKLEMETAFAARAQQVNEAVEAKIRENDASAHAKAYGEALEMPRKLINYYTFHRDIVLLNDAIIEMGHRISNYKRNCARWLGGESFESYPVNRDSELSPDFLQLARESRFLYFTPPPFRENLPMELMYVTPECKGGIPTDYFRYDPAANAAFRERLTKYIAAIESYHGSLSTFRNKQFEALNKMAGELQRTSLR
jgi:hypothetical protein